VPASAQAFEFYLRANQLSREPTSLDLARDMYLQALQADPKYAPAWAKLGHVYRVIGKFRSEPETVSRAESALNRALELNPDLSFADRVYAQIEVDYGRAEDAMVRLIRRASTRVNDPDLFAGLVHSCRYCGLFQASIAAHERARRLDPNVRTSLQYTLLMSGDYTRAVAEAGGLDSVAGMALTMVGHPDASRTMRQQADQFMAANMAPAGRFCQGVADLAEGKVSSLRSAVDAWIAAGLRDPEALFIHGLLLAGGGDYDRACELMSEAVSRGYLPYDTLTRHPWLNPLRDRNEFKTIVHGAQVRHEHAAAAFMNAGGATL
jgi:tetratricopeptide (TPR) repeat protein